MPVARLVIEEFLSGEEASFIVDGRRHASCRWPQARIIKRLLDGDLGPNTGGMGAYSPAPIVTPQLHARVMREIITPTVRGMEQEGIRFYRLPLCRLDDRRARQPQDAGIQLPHGRPGNAADHGPSQRRFFAGGRAAIAGTLDQIELAGTCRTALGVVLAAHGYPDAPRKGDLISGIPAETEETVVFHAGTTLADGKTGQHRRPRAVRGRLVRLGAWCAFSGV